MSTLPDGRLGTLRGAAADAARPARLDADLRTHGFATTRIDPRLVDPVLAEAVEAARRVAEEEGRAAGYADGYEAGRRAAAQEAAVIAAQTAAAVDAAEAARRQDAARVLHALEAAAVDLLAREALALTEVEDALVAAAVDLAEQVLGREVAVATSPGRDALARVLAMVPGNAAVTVRLHPEDAAVLGELAELAPGRAVDVLPDPGMARGDCLADSAGRHVDARISVALHRIREVLAR